jgi:hypothetical protein
MSASCLTCTHIPYIISSHCLSDGNTLPHYLLLLPVCLPARYDPELYLRWLQWGAHSPVMRTHPLPDPRVERRAWGYALPISVSKAVTSPLN